MAEIYHLPGNDLTEVDFIELDRDDVESVSGGVVPVAVYIALFALGYTMGRDVANR